MSREIRTQRLLLRPFQPDDGPAFGAFADDPSYRRFLGRGHPSAQQFVANNLKVDWERELSWVVSFDGAPVGSIFLGVDQQDKLAELACLIAPGFWRNGIASEAGQAVTAYAFDLLGLEKIFARAAEGNIASRRAMEKGGMTQEGVLRSHRIDHEGMSVDGFVDDLPRAEWRRHRGALRRG